MNNYGFNIPVSRHQGAEIVAATRTLQQQAQAQQQQTHPSNYADSVSSTSSRTSLLKERLYSLTSSSRRPSTSSSESSKRNKLPASLKTEGVMRNQFL